MHRGVAGSCVPRYCVCVVAGMVIGIFALAVGAAATIHLVDYGPA